MGEPHVVADNKSHDKEDTSYASPPSWDELSNELKAQFNNRENYDISLENINNAKPTVEGYRQFEANIKDISQEVNERFYHSSLYPSNREFNRPSKKYPEFDNGPRIILHFTTWKQPKNWSNNQGDISNPGLGFASAALNNGINNGAWGSANMYLAEDGTLYLITEPNQVAWNAGQFYSLEATGLEVPAEKQSGITSKQYEGIVYTIAWQWLSQYPDKIPTYEEMKKYIIGHGEITSVADVGNHTDFPRIIADEVAFQAYLFLQEYMK